MNLPNLHQLRDNQSTYITFSKALLDFDKAIGTGNKCYFTKMVALKLPNFENPEFFIDLSEVGVESTNPNVVLPKTIQYYMENIIRHSIGVNDNNVEEVAEIAFWKMLDKMGVDSTNRKLIPTFINTIATSHFVSMENNNGWGEVVCQVPNKCLKLTPVWRSVDTISDIVQSSETDECLFDNGLNQFVFADENKEVIDFDNCQYDDVIESSFDFNVLLLYYTDSTGINKLHGINFIYPFENKVSYWDLETFTQQTNKARTIGYQFKFNLKTCNNEASMIEVYNEQNHTHWNVFADTLGKLNSFLDLKMKENESDINR